MIRILPFLALISGLASAVPLRVEVIEWDANPPAENVTSYEVWRGIDRIAVVTEPEAKLELPYGSSVLTVRAINDQGVSPMSDPVRVPSITSRLGIAVEFSRNLKTWTEDFTPEARFARARIEIP